MAGMSTPTIDFKQYIREIPDFPKPGISFKDIGPLLHHVGALVTLGMGGLGLLFPSAAARLVAVEPIGRLGSSEIRATYGGLFAALGLFALATRDEVAFTMAGAAWLGAAAARVGDALWRGGERRVWGAACFEAAIALLLLAPA